MDFSNILQLNSNVLGIYNLTVIEIVIRLILSLIFGWGLAVLFIYTDKDGENGKYTDKAIVFTPIAISTALMALGNSITSAFGLFAALSIIRFRTPVKNIREMVFLFFAIVVGICLGVGAMKISILSISIFTIAMLVDQFINISNRSERYHVKIYLNNKDFSNCSSHIDEIFSKNVKKFHLAEIRTINNSITELVYRIRPVAISQLPLFLNELKTVDEIEDVILSAPLVS